MLRTFRKKNRLVVHHDISTADKEAESILIAAAEQLADAQHEANWIIQEAQRRWIDAQEAARKLKDTNG